MKQHSTDIQLLQNAKNGEHWAISSIYEQMKTVLFGYCIGILHDREKAEDAVHETFSKLLVHSRSILDASKLRAWLFTVARNECLGILRSMKRLEPIESDKLWTDDEEDILLEDQRKLVRHMVDSLAPQYREVVLLREFQGFSYSEIAEIVNISENAVKMRLFKARRALAKRLSPYLERKVQ